jgi:hypothetical protein
VLQFFLIITLTSKVSHVVICIFPVILYFHARAVLGITNLVLLVTLSWYESVSYVSVVNGTSVKVVLGTRNVAVQRTPLNVPPPHDDVCHVAFPLASEVRTLPAHAPVLSRTVPSTSSVAVGDNVPTQTLPVPSIYTLGILFVISSICPVDLLLSLRDTVLYVLLLASI